LVKPLDVAQIVPAVEQAYAEAQARARSAPPPSTARPEVVVPSPAPAAPAAAGQPTGEVALADPLRQPVALAVGILMHRLSLPRQAALERLQRLARQEGRPIEDSAAAMVAALEQLSLPGQL
jgi:response regulator NasT